MPEANPRISYRSGSFWINECKVLELLLNNRHLYPVLTQMQLETLGSDFRNSGSLNLTQYNKIISLYKKSYQALEIQGGTDGKGTNGDDGEFKKLMSIALSHLNEDLTYVESIRKERKGEDSNYSAKEYVSEESLQ